MSTRPVIDSLTGLRGVAALLVIVAHYAIWCAPYISTSRPESLGHAFDTAIYGMSCFFALSGFVITYNYLDFGWDRHPARSALRFMFLRLSRLYPALLVFILLVVMQHWSLTSSAEGFQWWTLLHVLSVQTWIPVTFNGQLTHEGAFHLSWSISTEIMLYLFFALFAVLTSNHWRFGKLFRFAIAGAGILYLFAINKMLHSPDPFNSFKALLPPPFGQLTEAQWYNWFYYLSPYSRIIDFTLGACAAHVVMRYRPYLSKYQPMFRWAANLALTGLVWLYLRPFLPQVLVPHAYYTQVAAAAFFAVILLNCEGNSGLNRVLSSASLVFLGEISFSLYLFHPLIARFGIFWPDRPFEPDLIPILLFNMAITGFTAVVFAYGMYRLVEMPGQRILRRLLVRTPMLEGHGAPLGVINRAP